MTRSHNRMRVYIRASHLTDTIKARILQMGCTFTQRDTIGEKEHAVTVWELSSFDAGDWEKVAKWMRDQEVDFDTEVLLPGKSR